MTSALRLTGRIIRYQASRFTLRGTLLTLVSLLLVTYVGLMALTMNYAVQHTEAMQQARDEEARVGTLEAKYFTLLAAVNATDPIALGYVKPQGTHFALKPSATAMADAAH